MPYNYFRFRMLWIFQVPVMNTFLCRNRDWCSKFSWFRTKYNNNNSSNLTLLQSSRSRKHWNLGKIYNYDQCFGSWSGSAWIHIKKCLQDPDPHGQMRIRIQEAKKPTKCTVSLGEHRIGKIKVSIIIL